MKLKQVGVRELQRKICLNSVLTSAANNKELPQVERIIKLILHLGAASYGIIKLCTSKLSFCTSSSSSSSS
jgi:hypothetical protein